MCQHVSMDHHNVGTSWWCLCLAARYRCPMPLFRYHLVVYPCHFHCCHQWVALAGRLMYLLWIYYVYDSDARLDVADVLAYQTVMKLHCYYCTHSSWMHTRDLVKKQKSGKNNILIHDCICSFIRDYINIWGHIGFSCTSEALTDILCWPPKSMKRVNDNQCPLNTNCICLVFFLLQAHFIFNCKTFTPRSSIVRL